MKYRVKCIKSFNDYIEGQGYRITKEFMSEHSECFEHIKPEDLLPEIVIGCKIFDDDGKIINYEDEQPEPEKPKKSRKKKVNKDGKIDSDNS